MHIAERRRPLNSSGGNVIGTRKMVLPIACSPSSFQNGWLLRRISTLGFDSGMVQRPMRSHRRGGHTREEDNSGTYDFRSRFRKSKMLCRAGCVPVLNEDHATGDTDGKVVFRRR